MSRRIPVVTLLLLLGLSLLALVGCASAAARAPEPQQSWYVDAARFSRSAHAGMDCGECHTDVAMQDVPGKHPSHEQVTQNATALFDYRACERCHLQEYAAYSTGVHADVRVGKRQPKSDVEAPTCGDCHRPHYEPPSRPRVELLSAQVETCGQCHPVEQETYLANFHGKAAVHLADARAAGCTDCHGGHAVASLVKAEDAVDACQRCHPSANANMAGFLIHAHETLPPPDSRRAMESTIFFYAKVFFTLLIFGTLGFFYLHTVAWLVSSAHRRMRGG